MSRTPVTVADSSFTFYDIESLSNAFTLCAYTPARAGNTVNTLDVFYLMDDAALVQQMDMQQLYTTIVTANPGMGDTYVRPWDLSTATGAYTLAAMMGTSTAADVCDKTSYSRLPATLRPVCDTDEGEYNPAVHPFLTGWNSQNYDTVMLANFLAEIFPVDTTVQHQPEFQPTTAREMRAHNDTLFTKHSNFMPGALGYDSPAAVFRRNMLRSGRHLDATRFNEVQIKVALKQKLGMLGRQILESEKLSHDTVITTVQDLYDLLAYNVSDCVGLSQLFFTPTYSNAFDLKASLIATYDETRYNRDGSVRRDRLSIDSSSAKLVSRILSPFGNLDDQPTVSFTYPHPQVAAERGVPVTNVLDDTEAFFRANIADPDSSDLTQAQRDAWEQFREVLAFYREIEDKNFNDSDHYTTTHGNTYPAQSLSEITKRALNIPYFTADATPAPCFVTFSTGGIHGAETNRDAFEKLHAQSVDHKRQIQVVRAVFDTTDAYLAAAKDQHNALVLPTGLTVDKRQMLIGSDPAKVRYRKPKVGNTPEAQQHNAHLAAAQQCFPQAADLLACQRTDLGQRDLVWGDLVIYGKSVLTSNSKTFRDEATVKTPQVFEDRDDGSNMLPKKFTYTSAGLVVHEDFTSYYPNLLRNMRAFYNPELGEDRYAAIFFQKEELGRQLKDPTLTTDQRKALINARNGTKLILNAASGAGDASHTTSIRMNNTIIAMRIIGQLLTWRIGQAQTLAGGRIISTNTDGLYSVIDHDGAFTVETNNRVLTEQQAAIGVDIEPELMFLISKDSNNRMELMPPKGDPELDPTAVLGDDESFVIANLEVSATGGGSLACYEEPLMTKSLAHPAVLDRSLAHYLQHTVADGERALRREFNTKLGRKLINDVVNHDDPVQTLRMFQNILSASRGSITYPFAADHQVCGNDSDEQQLVNPRALQMYNRVFVVKPETPGAVNLHMAAAPTISALTQSRRAAAQESPTRRDDAVAAQILGHHGWAVTRVDQMEHPDRQLITADRDIAVRKITGVDPQWPMLIVNDDLHCLSKERQHALIDALDLEIYTHMLQDTFTKNWRNT